MKEPKSSGAEFERRSAIRRKVAGSVDAAPIRRLLLEVAKRWQTGTIDDCKSGTDNGCYSPFVGMAFTCGVSADMVSKIAHGRRDSISFATAEKLVEGLVGPQAWHSEPDLTALLDSVVPVAA